jgi:hypothetical protein
MAIVDNWLPVLEGVTTPVSLPHPDQARRRGVG